MDDLLTLTPLSALRVISEKCGNTEDAPDSLPPMFTWSGDTFWEILFVRTQLHVHVSQHF